MDNLIHLNQFDRERALAAAELTAEAAHERALKYSREGFPPASWAWKEAEAEAAWLHRLKHGVLCGQCGGEAQDDSDLVKTCAVEDTPEEIIAQGKTDYYCRAHDKFFDSEGDLKDHGRFHGEITVKKGITLNDPLANQIDPSEAQN